MTAKILFPNHACLLPSKSFSYKFIRGVNAEAVYRMNNHKRGSRV
jgi:hypothetical protein